MPPSSHKLLVQDNNVRPAEVELVRQVAKAHQAWDTNTVAHFDFLDLTKEEADEEEVSYQLLMPSA